ncbi:MAG: AmmeMemoRadiSam system protein A [Desulfobacterales bacterium]
MVAEQATAETVPREKGRWLPRLARQVILQAFGKSLPDPERRRLEASLRDPVFSIRAGTFVTLTRESRLRGCIGNLSPCDTILEGVRRNALHAAFHDPRFSPLSLAELDSTRIEVSVLSVPQKLAFRDPQELLARLVPGRDGVVLKRGFASATFLPQVWEQLPRPEDFLGHLCLKAGLPRTAWKEPGIEVETYRVQVFEEEPGS